MVEPNEDPHGFFEPLFVLDEQGLTYDDPMCLAQKVTPNVIDSESLQNLDLPHLFNAVYYTRTKTGTAVLLRSILKPLDRIALLEEKQDSLREIAEKKDLRTSLCTWLDSLARSEPFFHSYLFNCLYCWQEPHNFRNVDQYRIYRAATDFIRHMVEGADNLPHIESSYLGKLLETILEPRDRPVFEFVKGPVYRTSQGLKTRDQVGLLTPRIKPTLRSFKPSMAVPYVTAVLVMLYYEPLRLLSAFAAMGLAPLLSSYPPMFDSKYFFLPLREKYVADLDLARAIDAMGLVDELLSFDEYSHSTDTSMILPKLVDTPSHRFIARNVKNPILVKQNPDYVPNNVNLGEERLTIITGANSGGKTTYCKTIAQIQLLAQIGCYVPAEEAELGVCDKIRYQTQSLGSLLEGEGRFETELKRTRDIFFEATPKSLVILDELAEATTYEEKMEISLDILEGFRAMGGSTILVTHNKELAKKMGTEGKTQVLQVEFLKDAPTYRLVEGVAETSQAKRVAERIGFSAEDIRTHLKNTRK